VTTSWVSAPLLRKEGRALAPIWVGAVITMVAATAAEMLPVALLAFVAGAAALGVFSIGHEYAHRTITTFLAQPLTRSRLLLSKIMVLTPLLILLSLVATLVLLQSDGVERLFGGAIQRAGFSARAGRPDEGLVFRWQLALVVMTPLLGLFVAPWMTMVCRNVMAGLVFTLSIPAGLWIAGQAARAASVNFDFVDLEAGSPFGYEPALTLMTVGLLSVIVVAAVHGRQLFVRLEALDTPRDLLPAAFGRLRRSRTAGTIPARHVARRRNLLFLFVQKEVRLHGLAFALAALYVAAWIALWTAGAAAYLADDTFQGFATMYGLFVALLVGALSIAEERALGTADSQRLQPWPFWKHSLTKLMTVGVITLVLGLGVPIALEAVLPLIDSSSQIGPDLGFYRFYLPNPLNGAAATLLLTTLFSCYVSSLSVGGLRALMATLPLSFSLFALNGYFFYVVDAVERMVRAKYGLQLKAGEFWLASVDDYRIVFLYSRRLAAVVYIGFAALLLFLYLRNSKSGENGIRLAKKQLPWIAVCAVLAAVLMRGGETVLRWWLFTR
jgi:hypothetical protein